MGQKNEIFCEIRVSKKYSKDAKKGYLKISGEYVSENYFVSINLGDGKGWNWLKTESDIEYTCDSQVEAMNYMARKGWRMIKNYRDTDANRYYLYNILFRKKLPLNNQ